MRENVIKTIFSSDNKYRFEIIDRKDNTYQVWVEKFVIDDDDELYPWSGWIDFNDGIHITDTIERAMEIGHEVLRNQA